MTNQDLKRELELVNDSLSALQTLSAKCGVEAIELTDFVTLLKDRYDDLHSNLVSVLNVYELVETVRAEGEEAANKLADEFRKEIDSRPTAR